MKEATRNQSQTKQRPKAWLSLTERKLPKHWVPHSDSKRKKTSISKTAMIIATEKKSERKRGIVELKQTKKMGSAPHQIMPKVN